jgi:signal transduction histidine kinase
MRQPTSTSVLSKATLPAALVWAVTVICVLPFCLSLAGVDFSTQARFVDATLTPGPVPQGVARAFPQTQQGSLTHTLLEWSAFCTAIFTVFLAFIHFNIKRDITTLVIGLALFCAGTMDALYTLVADHLLAEVTDSRNFMPFIWAVSRLFNALIMTVGAGLCLVTRTSTWQGNPGVPLLVSVGVGAVGYWVIQASAASAHLPQMLFPEAIVTRPYDAAPLIVFLAAGVFVYPRLYQRLPSLFSHALIISTLPNVAAQLHMAFGSAALFDAHFNMAHLLKIIAYLVPFSGLALDYIRTYREEALAVQQLTEAQASLVERSAQLERVNADLLQRNTELDEFSYVASHDLQEPVRKLIAFSDHLRRDLGSDLPPRAAQDVDFIVDAAVRMQALIQDLLALSRAGRMDLTCEWVSLNTCVDHVLEALAVRLQETGARITRDPLPMVWGDPTLLIQLYQNLIENALKFVDHGQPVLRLTAEQYGEQWIFGVQDHGIGLKPEYAEHIFLPFKRLHDRAEYPGTGIGLAICRKAVERHGGRIWVESQPGQGAHFKFTLLTPGAAEQRTGHDTQQR